MCVIGPQSVGSIWGSWGRGCRWGQIMQGLMDQTKWFESHFYSEEQWGTSEGVSKE